MDMINRAAVIIYTPHPTDKNDMLILVGVNRFGITSIGGGKEYGEQEIQCTIRECKEETRDLIDFTNCKVILKQAKTFKHNRCIYYLVPGTFETLVEICKEFPSAKHQSNDNDTSNEMDELRLISINETIKKLVCNDRSTANLYQPKFAEMFVDIGYDRIKGNVHNHQVLTINMPANLTCHISDLPLIVSISAINYRLPVVYGTVTDETTGATLYISQQLYYDNGNEAVFRNMIMRDGKITVY